MEIKQIRILTTKMEDPQDKEKQIDVLTVALAYDKPTTEEDAEVKQDEFAVSFPVELFNSPAGYGLAIETAFKGFAQFQEQEKAKNEEAAN